MEKELEIEISSDNRILTIIAPVKDSLHASLLADRINILPYLKVFDRLYNEGFITIKCYIIKGVYKYEKFVEDLDTMNDLILIEDEKDN